jgi:hypothetical protein
VGLVVGVGLLAWVWLWLGLCHGVGLCCSVGLMVGLGCRRGCGGWFVLPTWVWLGFYSEMCLVRFVFRWVWWLICVSSMGVVDFRSCGFRG